MSKSNLVKCRVRLGRKFHGIEPRKPGDKVVRFTAKEGDVVEVSRAAAERFTNNLQPMEDFKREEKARKEAIAEAQGLDEETKPKKAAAAKDAKPSKESKDEKSKESKEGDAAKKSG